MSQLHVTDKLIETAALMVAGYSVKQIAANQGVSKTSAQKRYDKVRLWFRGQTAQESGAQLIRGLYIKPTEEESHADIQQG